ncbi:MAG: class I SAM-dependent methyltransferase [Candidatus Dadabacteria bacterium]|nr:class I SAM-dependent methyltransferase [Candidatus Dadabacteria bacterium]NIS08750.1 class I SAM-dependent methyltransferase [Candidatus Dadabacteria bacterium]NIV42693.1 methyltransferase domain-containing protein [Candidatus Dadabacteria bacterium]NIX15436.1 methyltransferase domain-containing protein [Candidatus Dadabacteria bacterium]NIY22098.1 methyltransferase domain-containing protein [Candidatus Dadabacteria bacterium]
MGLEHIKSIPVLKDLYFKLWLEDAQSKIKHIENYLGADKKILDIGCGPGSVCLLLNDMGFNVTALDVKDLTYTDKVKPAIYDGSNIPFKDKEFDTSLLLTVLHHVYDPEALLKEAIRVSEKIIIIEDVYNGTLQQYLTYIADSLVNFEIIGHPHTNKSDKEWKEQFGKLGLKLSNSSVNNYMCFFKQAVYVLET